MVKYHYYAVTLRKTTPIKTSKQVEPLVNRYYKILNFVKTRNTKLSIRYTLESDLKKNGSHNVHLHGVIKSPYCIANPLKLFPREKGMHVYAKPALSKAAWDKYMDKDKTSMQDIIDLIESREEVSHGSEELIEIPPDYSKINLFIKMT